MKANPTIASNTQSSPGDVMALCIINIASASKHSMPPVTDTHLLEPVLSANLALAKFTIANIMRKPELPMTEIFVKSKTFAIRSVNREVMSSPSIGRLQTI